MIQFDIQYTPDNPNNPSNPTKPWNKIICFLCEKTQIFYSVKLLTKIKGAGGVLIAKTVDESLF